MFDQLAVVSPIMLALSAATPIHRCDERRGGGGRGGERAVVCVAPVAVYFFFTLVCMHAPFRCACVGKCQAGWGESVTHAPSGNGTSRVREGMKFTNEMGKDLVPPPSSDFELVEVSRLWFVPILHSTRRP